MRSLTSPRLLPRPIARPLWAVAAALVVAGAVVLSVALWAHYGATVFFETIRAGLASCLG